MNSARGPESVLRIFCGRSRASEIVGDLLEQGKTNPTRLWRAILGVLFVMNWRWLAAMATWVAFLIADMSPVGMYVRRHAGEHVDPAFFLWTGRWSLAGVCVMTAVLLNVFQFGFRNRITTLGLGWSVLLTAIAWLGRVPHIGSAALVLCFTYAAVCLGLTQFRGPFLCLCASNLTYAGIFYLLLHLLLNFSDPSPVLILRIVCLAWFLSFVSEAWVLVKTRRLFLEVSELAG